MYVLQGCSVFVVFLFQGCCSCSICSKMVEFILCSVHRPLKDIPENYTLTEYASHAGLSQFSIVELAIHLILTGINPTIQNSISHSPSSDTHHNIVTFWDKNQGRSSLSKKYLFFIQKWFIGW